MIAYPLCLFLVGAVLGLRFKVTVLLPITVAIAVATPFFSFLNHLTLLESLKALAFCVLSLNAGYLFGSLARFAIAAARSTRLLVRPIKVMR